MATLEELRARQTAIKARRQEIDAEFVGQALPDDAREEWNELSSELEENDKLIEELETRTQILEEQAQKSETKESGSSFYVNMRKSQSDIYDLSEVRVGADNPSQMKQELRDRALRAVETALFPHGNKEDIQGTIERLLAKDDRMGSIARHLLLTGNPSYQSGFGKYISGQRPNAEEERVMSLTTNSGGFAVPFVLDPTIILTSNGAINPFRAISRIEQITVDEWRGVSSAGVTASFDAELAEVSDDSLTLAQPTISTEMARAFVPFSIELGMDWAGIQGELARAINDAKDVLEATVFATGTGTNQPYGAVTSATVFTVGTRGSVVSTDWYGLETALPPRFRPLASFVMNRAIAHKIRQIDTQGGAQLWIDNLRLGLANQFPAPGNYGSNFLGYGAYESSAMVATNTTGDKVALFGDFNHYVIADRVGLTMEYIPHMFNTANNLPSGERGLFAYWRVGAGVVATSAIRVLLA